MKADVSNFEFRGGFVESDDLTSGFFVRSLFDLWETWLCFEDDFSVGTDPARFRDFKQYLRIGNFSPAVIESQSQVALTMGISHSCAWSALSFLKPMTDLVSRIVDCGVMSSLYFAP